MALGLCFAGVFLWNVEFTLDPDRGLKRKVSIGTPIGRAT